jgi:hypothetical protein
MEGKGGAILSKSTFVRGLQCEKSLYLHKRRPFLRDALSPEQLDKFSRGTDVGQYARSLFPGGVNAAPKTHFQMQASVDLTEKLIAEGQKVIYEAAFRHNDVIIALDILVMGENGWQAIEVKSSMAISETFLWDASLQYYVMSGAGVDVLDFAIAYINSSYQRAGDLDAGKLFKIESVLGEVLKRKQTIHQKVLRLKEVTSLEKAPEVPVGLYCHEPYPCDFIGHCWKKIPAGSVFEVYGLDDEKKFSFFNNGLVQASQIPPEDLNPLTSARHAESIASGLRFIDTQKLISYIGGIHHKAALVWCLYIKPALPIREGTRPYQALPVMVGFQDIDMAHGQRVIGIPDGYITDEIMDEINNVLKNYSTLLTFGNNHGLDALAGHISGSFSTPDAMVQKFPDVVDLSMPFSDFSIVWPKMGPFTSPGALLQALGKQPEPVNPKIKVLQNGQIPLKVAGEMNRIPDINYDALKGITRATLNDMAGLLSLIRELISD